MIIVKEVTSRNKELLLTITPVIHKFAKSSASPKAVFDLATRLATILEQWDYTPKEIKGLDRRAFIDLIRSWQSEASAQDMAIINSVI